MVGVPPVLDLLQYILELWPPHKVKRPSLPSESGRDTVAEGRERQPGIRRRICEADSLLLYCAPDLLPKMSSLVCVCMRETHVGTDHMQDGGLGRNSECR